MAAESAVIALANSLLFKKYVTNHLMQRIQFFRLVDVQARMALKADAEKYFLGYIWWILEPLLYVGVFYVVFDIILRSGRGDFLAFLMCGKLPFVWFSKSVNQASNSIVNSAGLIGKINIPKTLFPMAVIQEGLYRQAAVFALLFAVVISLGHPMSWIWLWVIPVALVQYLMIVACALIGATIVCYIRDFSMLIALGMIFLMFTSGIFWDIHSLDSQQMTDFILAVNPLAFILDCYRQVLMYGRVPDIPHLLTVALGFACLIFVTAKSMKALSQNIALRALTV